MLTCLNVLISGRLHLIYCCYFRLEYILDIILSNYDEDATILISTHLIADIENILDEVIFIKNGQIELTSSVDEIRESQGKSVDALFREVFKC